MGDTERIESEDETAVDSSDREQGCLAGAHDGDHGASGEPHGGAGDGNHRAPVEPVRQPAKRPLQDETAQDRGGHEAGGACDIECNTVGKYGTKAIEGTDYGTTCKTSDGAQWRDTVEPAQAEVIG